MICLIRRYERILSLTSATDTEKSFDTKLIIKSFDFTMFKHVKQTI